MERSKLFLAVVATLAAACEAPTAPNAGNLGAGAAPGSDAASTSQTTFSGEATVVRASVTPGIGEPITVNLVETGKLPESGGALTATLLKLEISKTQTGGVLGLDATVGQASTVGQGKSSHSEATVADLALEVAGQPIEATFLEAAASAVCDAAGNAVSAASSAIASLTVAGQPITVTGERDQVIDLPLLGLKIMLNEQDVKQSGNRTDVTVNALHITASDPVTGKKVDVIVAQAHADIRCGRCTDQGDDFTTGGGWIVHPETGDRANFAISGGKRTGWGHLTYHDRGAKLTVKSETIHTYDHDYTSNTSTITGTATVNGIAGQPFEVTVHDAGEPGRGADTFKIVVGGYVAGNELGGGNIQFHDKPSRCPET
jgi:hypothetical protein